MGEIPSAGQEFVATIVDGKGKLGFKLAQQRVPGDFYAFVVEHVDAGGVADVAGILRGAQLLAVNNKLVVFAGNKATDFYEVLGVETNASRAAIRKAYLQKALDRAGKGCAGAAPDARAASEDPGDGGAFVLISEAYATLADESHRASYDAMRAAGAAAWSSATRRQDGPGQPGPRQPGQRRPAVRGGGVAPRAALQDDAEAQLLVAIALVRINTTGERRKALQHAERAAGAAARSATRGKSGTREQDMAKTLVSSEAAYLAGLMHLVDFDASEAEKLFRAAADVGHPYAKDRLKELGGARRARGGCLCCRPARRAARRLLLVESFREWEQIRRRRARRRQRAAEEIPVASPTSPTAVLAAFLFCDGGASKYSKAFNGMICSSKRDGFGSMVCFEQGSKKTQIHATEDVLEDIEYAWSQNAGHAGDDFDDMGAQVALHVAELDDEANAAALVPADYDFGDGNPLQLVERTEEF
ncbi:hypothetical protein SO694_00087176 [Aureococcus anophagefferens]|uniref:J domain-containing protein n=1 Tax=Aureococcus anophagefferens TaxID=44056 RepID=A0ABR1G4Z1_AURAN